MDDFEPRGSGDAGPALLERPDFTAFDDEDKARLMTAFIGGLDVPLFRLHYVEAAPEGGAPAYMFDDETGMVYILD